jgi:hypothetical protein
MNKAQIISAIQQRLSNRTGLSSEIITELDLQQSTILERKGRVVPWFLTSEVATATLFAGEDRLPVPLNFLVESEAGGLFYYVPTAQAGGEPWNRLTKLEWTDAILQYQNTEGSPIVYSLAGEYFRVRPLPDQSYTLKLLYIRAEPSFSGQGDDFTNAWSRFAPDLLIATVAEAMARLYIQDFELATALAQDVERGWDRVFAETEAQANTNRSYTMGRR